MSNPAQGFQAHDAVPREIAGIYGQLFEDYLPGWSVNGAYNYDVRPSSQKGAVQSSQSKEAEQR